MAITGADIEQLRALANKLTVDWAGQIESLTGTINTSVQASTDIWVGPDADQFRNDIWPTHKTALDNARDALTAAGDTAKVNADAQETTSSAIA